MQRVLSSLFLAGRRSYSYSDEPQYHTKYFVAAAYFYQLLHCAAGVGVCFGGVYLLEEDGDVDVIFFQLLH